MTVSAVVVEWYIDQKTDSDFYIFLQNYIHKKECSTLQVLLEVYTTESYK